jgi:hypothetical protein
MVLNIIIDEQTIQQVQHSMEVNTSNKINRTCHSVIYNFVLTEIWVSEWPRGLRPKLSSPSQTLEPRV